MPRRTRSSWGGFLFLCGFSIAVIAWAYSVDEPQTSTPRPAVTATTTVTKTVTAHPWLTGGDLVAISIAAAVVAIVAMGWLLRNRH